MDLQSFRVSSYCFRDLPVDDRGAVSLTTEEIPQFYQIFRDFVPYEECFVLSTCNRVEIYYFSQHQASSLIGHTLGLLKGFQKRELQPEIRHLSGEGALQHFLEVCNGLQSQIPGDVQVINQLKQAYQRL